ncbi:MAG: hypothetical protein ACOY9D_05390 [Pseudomonadota bacterium]
MKKINKGANLPDQDHVIRHVPWARLLRDEDDNILGFLPQAFALRPIEEAKKSISVNWLEYFGDDHTTNIKKSIQGLRTTKKIGGKSAFGIGGVAKIKEVCKKNGALVKIVYAPTDGNPSHSAIRNLPIHNQSLLQALATAAFIELVCNADIPN